MAKKKKPDEAPAEQSAEGAVATLPMPSTNGHHEAKPPPVPQTSTPPPEKNGPVKSYSCPVNGGTINVDVFGKEIQVEGKTVVVYSMTITKRFKNDLGEWRTSNYLRGTEAPVAVRLIEKAAAFMIDARTDESPIPF